MSLGGAGASTTLGDAVAYAYGKGVTIVAAAGNEAQEGNPPSYPAAYDDYVIAVAATRYDQTRAYYSNYGSYVDIAAPGGDTTVDQNGDGYPDGVLQNTFNPTTQQTNDFGYWFFQGTSMATPHVAGVAALVIATGLTAPDQVRAAIQTTARDKGAAGWDPYYGWGIVDAYGAVSYTAAPSHDVAVAALTAPPSIVRGDQVTVTVSASNPGDYAETFDVTLTDTTAATVLGTQTVTALAAGATQTLTFTWDTAAAALGSHVLQAEAAAVTGETNLADNAKSASVSVLLVGQTMHVGGIALTFKVAGLNTAAVAAITVVDSAGTPVPGATVSAQWSGATTDSDTAVTDTNGVATVQSNNVKRAKSGATYVLTVNGVSLAGWTYDATANTETTDSISIP